MAVVIYVEIWRLTEFFVSFLVQDVKINQFSVGLQENVNYIHHENRSRNILSLQSECKFSQLRKSQKTTHSGP